MQAKRWIRIAVLVFASFPWPCDARQPEDTDELPRKELLVLRDEVIKAYEARDIDGVLAHVHPDVIATWQNGFRARGRDEVRQFFNEMMTGESRIVRDVKSTLSVDGASVMFGDDAAVACGALIDEFDLASGTSLHLESKWTSTLVKIDGRWLIASFHVSASIFENPILAALRSWAITLAIVVGAVGVLLGVVAGRLVVPRKPS